MRSPWADIDVIHARDTHADKLLDERLELVVLRTNHLFVNVGAVHSRLATDH